MEKSLRKILLVAENTSFYCRSLIIGISKFAKMRGQWSFYRDFDNIAYGPAVNLQTDFFSSLDTLRIDGVITRNYEKTKLLTDRGVPTIVARTDLETPPHVPKLEIDHQQVGQMAAVYFLEKGYKTFAYCGYPSPFSTKRQEAYCKEIQRNGFTVNVYSPRRWNAARSMQLEILALAEWLKSLPRPTAVFVCGDARALNVIDAAHIAGIHIPGQMIVLGVDNDDFLCNTCDIPLSSIMLNAENGGAEAAELLERLMAGEKMSGQQILIRPIQVITRVSTESCAIEDPDVLKAMMYIQEQKYELLQIEDVARHVAVSRRYLQKKFQKTLNTTLFNEIQHARINCAKELLLNTPLNVSEISEQMHFAGVNCFSRYFKKYTQMTPLTFRRKFHK